MRALRSSLVWAVLLCVPTYVSATGLYEAPPAPAGSPVYTVQVETLSSKANAEAHTRKLRSQGYPAYLHAASTDDGRRVYKIRIGSYAGEQEGRAALQDYTSRSGRPAFLVQTRAQETAAKPAAAAAGMHDEDKPPEAAYYAIQTAAVLEKQPAQRHLRYLRERGYPAYILEKPAAGGRTLYQIRFGQYPDEPSARAAADAYSAAEKREPRPLVVRSRIALDPALTAAGAPAVPVRPPADTAAPAAGSNGDWPEKTTTIYGYRWPEDELNLTNTLERIPPNLRHTIEYLSVYPVRYLGPDPGSRGLLVESATHGRQAVLLAGVSFPSPQALERAHAYCAEHYRTVPLRLKYNPTASSATRAVAARLYRKEGGSINRELISLGLGAYCPDTAVPDQAETLQQAATAAQAQRRGMWAEAQ